MFGPLLLFDHSFERVALAQSLECGIVADVRTVMHSSWPPLGVSIVDGHDTKGSISA